MYIYIALVRMLIYLWDSIMKNMNFRNYLEVLLKKYQHIKSNNSGHAARTIVNNTLDMLSKILPVIINIAGLTRYIMQKTEIITRRILNHIRYQIIMLKQ